MRQLNANSTRSLKEAKLKPWGPLSKPSVAVLILLLLAFAPPVRRRLTGTSVQALAAKLTRIVLSDRYRFYEIDPAMIWNNGRQFDPVDRNVDFLSKVVIFTDSPSLLLFARFNEPDHAPQFDISIDGQASEILNWQSVLMPRRLALGAPGDHTVVIRANPLLFNRIGTPFPLTQNVITGFAVPGRYHIAAKPEPARRTILVTVTDSIGQGYGTRDPTREAWTARLADSGVWPGAVMNRGYVGARLTDFCSSATSCQASAASLDRDYPNAAVYYLALGTNDFLIEKQCVSSSLFASSLLHLLQGIHLHNPQATVYLQTPIHRADEAQMNSCGDTLFQFRDAEMRVAQTLSWVRPIDGFSPSFPQISQGSAAFLDGIHPTAQGQEQYFQAVVKSLLPVD